MDPTLKAIVTYRHAWISAAELRSAGGDPADLEALEVDGLVERWPIAGVVLWCLTPLAASRLGVVLDERWERQSDGAWLESPRWVEPDRVSVVVRLPGRHGGYRLAELAEDLDHVEPSRANRRSRPVQALDPVSAEPLYLFGGIPVWRDRESRLKPPRPATPRRLRRPTRL